jgi:thiosulfate dehydrogenase (quinone) large subunit
MRERPFPITKESIMTTIKDTGSHQAPERAPEGHASRSAAHTAMGVLRLIIGWTFLWAFFDKLLALGYSTGKDPVTGNVDRFGDAAWIHGGSPTEGFLGFAADGPFQSFYNSIAGDAWADWAFMLGLLAIGISLTFGIFSRLGTFAGVVMYLLMWTVVLPPENNPFTDEHLIGAAAVLVCGLYGAGRYLGLGRWWNKQTIVNTYPVLK